MVDIVLMLDRVHGKVTALPTIETKEQTEVTIIRARTPGSFVVWLHSGDSIEW